MGPVTVSTIGSYIREQREQAKISVRQLAQAAGISNPYLSQVERGLRKPSAEILQQIAKGLRISAEALYVQAGILDDRPADTTVPDAVRADSELTERQKQMLIEIYESFRKEVRAAEVRAAEAARSAEFTSGISSSRSWATATSAAGGGGFSALIDAAQKEGTLNVIALPPHWVNYGAIISEFSKTYGLKVVAAKPVRSSQVAVAAVQDEDGTAAAPDVLDISMAAALANTELFAPYQVETWHAIPAAQKDPAGLWYQSYGGYMSIGYDSARFGTITSVSQMLGPQFAGAVTLSGNPMSAGSALIGVMMVNLAAGGTPDDISAGVDFFRQLKAAGNFGPAAAVNGEVSSGSTPVVIRWDYLNAAAALTEPAATWQVNSTGEASPASQPNSTRKVSVPANAVLAGFYAQAISKNAPHPAAARLWEEFLYSQAPAGGQNLWLRGGARPVEMAAMAANGSVNAAAAAALPQVTGTPVFLNRAQAADASRYLAAHWARAVS